MAQNTDITDICIHLHWTPVEGEFGAYQCDSCKVYGYRVGARQGKNLAGRKPGDIVPWADGHLRKSSNRSRVKGETRPKDLTNLPKLHRGPKLPRLGVDFVEPPPEKNR